jgi:hypothetical protein
MPILVTSFLGSPILEEWRQTVWPQRPNWPLGGLEPLSVLGLCLVGLAQTDNKTSALSEGLFTNLYVTVIPLSRSVTCVKAVYGEQSEQQRFRPVGCCHL